MSERGEALSVCERETEAVEIIFMFSSFTAAIGAHSIFEEVSGFSPLWFPRGKFFVSLVSCVSLEEISTQNGPFNFNSNSMSSCVIQ